MHFPASLASLGLVLLAGTASAAPHPAPTPIARRSASGQNVVYWGQNGGGTIENNDLSTYCTSTSGIDIIVLAFLYEFGNGNEIPSGTIGQSCYISAAGEGQNCDALVTAIETCQSAGVKMILSLGGASSSWSLASASEAETIGQNLWDVYGGGTTTIARPLGSVVVDGFDFDLESVSGNEYFPNMISTLRTAFATDTSKSYYITGAPQCPLPEPNMGAVIQDSKFDYLWPQFYNNNNYTYPCALGFNGNAAFNYNEWVSFVASTDSAGAKIFIGVPAAPLAANGSPSGEIYYITPAQLAELVAEYSTNSAFGGIMMWSAGFSDTNVVDGCTYAQQAHHILVDGTACDGAPITTTIASTATTATKTATATTSTTVATGSPVAQWGQCGGEGYTGSTVCASPYTCVATGAYWSQCE